MKTKKIVYIYQSFPKNKSN